MNLISIAETRQQISKIFDERDYLAKFDQLRLHAVHGRAILSASGFEVTGKSPFAEPTFNMKSDLFGSMDRLLSNIETIQSALVKTNEKNKVATPTPQSSHIVSNPTSLKERRIALAHGGKVSERVKLTCEVEKYKALLAKAKVGSTSFQCLQAKLKTAERTLALVK